MRSDEALLEQFRRGDLRAFDELYERHARHLHGFIAAQVGAADAPDVLNETFVALFSTRPSVASARAWLFQVARNACLNRLRSARRADAATSVETRLTPVSNTPHDELESLQRRHTLTGAVARLPPDQAQLFHLRARGLSYQELADVLSVPLGTIKSRLHELVKRLREEVSHDA